MLSGPAFHAGKGSPDDQERERGGENPANKRMAELVTPALIVHGTLSSHLSHPIETPVCDSVCLERLLALLHLPIPMELGAQEAP